MLWRYKTLILIVKTVLVVCADVIPTFVTEMGDTLMSELDDDDIISAVGSLDSDRSSQASSPG